MFQRWRRGSTAGRCSDAAAAVLSADPTASLAQVAAAAGVGRTTLHRAFATRDDLLRALALDAIERLDRAVEAARPGEGSAPEVLRRVAGSVLPLADEFRFLEAGPDVWNLPELLDGWYRISAVLADVVERGKREGDLRPDVPTVLLVELMTGAIWAVGDAVGEGRVARESAADDVVDVLLGGAATLAGRRAGGRR